MGMKPENLRGPKKWCQRGSNSTTFFVNEGRKERFRLPLKGGNCLPASETPKLNAGLVTFGDPFQYC